MENNKDPTALISVNKQKLDIQCHTQTYFHTNESVRVPKKWAQIFKNFTNFFFYFNQFNNRPFFLPN